MRRLTCATIDALAAYQAATGAVNDDATGLLKVTPAQFAALPNLDFNIGGVRSIHVPFHATFSDERPAGDFLLDTKRSDLAKISKWSTRNIQDLAID